MNLVKPAMDSVVAKRHRARDDHRDAQRAQRVRRKFLHELGERRATGTISSPRSWSRTSTGNTERWRDRAESWTRRTLDGWLRRLRRGHSAQRRGLQRGLRHEWLLHPLWSRGRDGPELWDAIANVHSLADVRPLAFIPKVYLAMTAAFSPDAKVGAAVRRPSVCAARRTTRVGRWRLRQVGRARAARHDSEPRRRAAKAPRPDVRRRRERQTRVGRVAGRDGHRVHPGGSSPHVRDVRRRSYQSHGGCASSSRVLPFFSRTLDFGDGDAEPRSSRAQRGTLCTGQLNLYGRVYAT